jgi:hypothetical protein
VVEAFTRGPVVVSGDNPGMTLYDGDRRVAVVSYWNVELSEAGAGRALVTWTDAGGSFVLTDAPQVATLVNERLTRHFPEFEGIDLSGVEVGQARFEVEMDLGTGLVVRTSGARAVEVRWSEPMSARLVHWPGFRLGGERLDLTLTLLPCRAASLAVDGASVGGAPQLHETGERPRSSAFIAVAETWTYPG